MRPVSLLLCLVSLVIPTGCTSPVPEPVPLRISSTRVVGSLPVWVAQEQGFFRRHGLQVTLTHPDTGAEALRELAEGRSDLATASDTVATLAAVSGTDFTVVTTLGSTAGGNALVARKDHGVNSPQDLQGKRVGYTPRSSSDFFLHTLLVLHRIPAESIRKVPMGQAEMQTALVAGKIDAASLWHPHLAVAVKNLGDKAFTTGGGDIFDQYIILGAGNGKTGRNPDVIHRVLLALMDAVTFMNGNHEETLAILNRHVAPKGPAIITTLSGYHFDIALDQDLLVNQLTVVKWGVQEGYLTREQAATRDPAAQIDTAPLEGINPDHVNLIK